MNRVSNPRMVLRDVLHARKVAAFHKRLEDPRYAPLSSLPVSEDFASGLRFIRTGIYRHSSGAYLKLGGLLEKTLRSPFQHKDAIHHDYAIRFPTDAYGSQAKAVQAAALHAQFYRRLVKDGVMHPRTQVIIHDFKGAPALTVFQPALEVHGSRFLGLMAEHPQKLLEKLYAEYPGLDGLSHEDLTDDLNYGRTTIPKNGPAPLHSIRREAWYLHDLHLFKDPHAERTLDWIRKTLEKRASQR